MTAGLICLDGVVVLLINTILTNVNTTNKLYKLYDAISHIQVGEKKFTQNDIFGIIINIAIDKKIGDISYNELCQKSKKEIQFYSQKNNIKIILLEGIDIQTVSEAVGRKCGIVAVNDKGFADAILKFYNTSDCHNQKEDM